MAAGSCPVGVGPGYPTLDSGGNNFELTCAYMRAAIISILFALTAV